MHCPCCLYTFPVAGPMTTEQHLLSFRQWGSAWWEATTSQRAGWRSGTTESGAPCVTTTGTMMTPRWSVVSWGLHGGFWDGMATSVDQWWSVRLRTGRSGFESRFWGRNSSLVVYRARCSAWCSVVGSILFWGECFPGREDYSLGVNMDSDYVPPTLFWMRV